ncbi:UDP-N-acetylglucosamine transporter-like isoform X4 [Dermacentor andersoni]|uniref:UDP-N-acetylglucosamine transporter-like isoform X4 n=1 Tax=Dermacentor andersoni TaxID=34620 RepID=UPI003B3A49C2
MIKETTETAKDCFATRAVFQMANALKYTSLVFIVVQTTAMVLLLRYSRTQAVQGPRYLSSTAVVCAEFLKILSCIAVLLWENGFSVPALVLQLRNEVWRQPKETCKMLVPAGLYTVQNNLLFFALSLLDAATYQMPTEEEALGTTAKQGSYQFLGLIAVLISCLSSGFSGIYLEKLLKEITWSLWIRNIQLAIFGCLLGIVAMLMSDWNQLWVGGFFQGYNVITWIVILLQTFGGLVVSLAVRYADSILKGFATSISIVLSTFCSYYLLGDLLPTRNFFFGAGIVITATSLYGVPLFK